MQLGALWWLNSAHKSNTQQAVHLAKTWLSVNGALKQVVLMSMLASDVLRWNGLSTDMRGHKVVAGL